ncbi:TonB-dependent receptor [Aurantiacibacter poecillastricola]|uniref:TonB-dependent receptor n=1 Tax=Aurantiacibacter poecillastricola TaxID=3064385 RepID=UPI00273F099B|nr:TonB-dependent receptor [Aurantiacibacter sp. 219JJ12-13]MDP5263248.1 TonB-dependent receptor [Aurantiacibacter sp. 219JJ12-13]
MTTQKKVLWASASAVMAFVASPALAQAAGEDDEQGSQNRSSGVSDIVVTATRRETNLQDTPIAITAVSSETLTAQSIENTAELSRVVPNASFELAQGAFGPGLTAFIRGIGQSDSNLAGEPGVAFYIDDVYYPLVFGSMFDLLDLERVEVLRGPQGTLFGRNSLAGAVNLVSRTPDLGEAYGSVEVTVGSYERRELRASANVPLGDTLALSVAGLSKDRRGYQERLDFRCEQIRRGTPELAGDFPFSDINLANDQLQGTLDDCVIGHLGGEEVRAFRGQLYWEPSDRFDVTISADYLKDRSDNAMDYILEIDPGVGRTNPNVAALYDQYTPAGGPTFALDDRFVTGDPYQTYANFADLVPAGGTVPGSALYNGSPFRGGIINPPIAPIDSWGLSGKINVELADDIELITILGYRDFEAVFSYDPDGTPLAFENFRNDVFQEHYSIETRLVGSRGWVDWVAGLFYFNGEGTQRFTGTSSLRNYVRYTDNIYESESKAAYLNVTLSPFERLSLTLGGRYSDETKLVDNFNAVDATDANSTELVFEPNSAILFNLDLGTERFDWKVGLDYELNSDVMVYASAATGFRLPGFNSRPLQPSQVAQIPGDETLSYELGVKADLFERMLRLNLTGFYTDYKTRPAGLSGNEYFLDPATGEPQPGNQVLIPSPLGDDITTCRPRTQAEIDAGVPGFACIGRVFYRNQPGEVIGFELEAEFRPTDALSMGGSVGYHNFSAPDYDSLPDGANKRPLAIPELQANFGVQYEFVSDALGGSLTPRLDWFYTGSQVYNETRTEFNQDGYSLVNARLTYDNDEYDFTLAAGVTNLFDNFYWRNYFIYQRFGSPQNNAQPGLPREWYLSMTKRF